MVKKCHVPDDWTLDYYSTWRGDYRLGNKYSPVAVLIPTKDDLGLKLQEVAINSGVAIAGFCYTSNVGIEKVIQNILANPNIRYLIVTGHENKHKSGKAIIMLWKYGIDEKTRRIKCSEDEACSEEDIPTGYVPNLPLEAIERFRQQVKVIDYLWNDNVVKEENTTVNEVTIGSKSFKIRYIPVDVDENEVYIGLFYKDKNEYLEGLRFLIHSCIQEIENNVPVHVIGKYLEEYYNLYDSGAFDDKPYIVKIEKKEVEPEVNVNILDNGRIVILEAPDPKHAYLSYMKLIESGVIGFERPTRHGLTRDAILIEIIHYIPRFKFREEDGKIIIEDFEFDEYVPETYPLKNKEYFKMYCEDILNGINRTGETYAYGEILRKFGKELFDWNVISSEDKISDKFDIEIEKTNTLYEYLKNTVITDQLQHLINRMISKPLERNHIITFWNPIVDIANVRLHEPCFTLMDFKIIPSSDGYWYLYCVVEMRSHDYRNAHEHNLYGIFAVMNYIYWKLKETYPQLRLGKLIYIITSSHIYIKQEAR